MYKGDAGSASLARVDVGALAEPARRGPRAAPGSLCCSTSWATPRPALALGVRIWGIRLGVGPTFWRGTIGDCRVHLALLPVPRGRAPARRGRLRHRLSRHRRRPLAVRVGSRAWRAPIISAAGGSSNLVGVVSCSRLVGLLGRPPLGTAPATCCCSPMASNFTGYLNLLPCFRSDGIHLLAHIRAARFRPAAGPARSLKGRPAVRRLSRRDSLQCQDLSTLRPYRLPAWRVCCRIPAQPVPQEARAPRVIANATDAPTCRDCTPPGAPAVVRRFAAPRADRRTRRCARTASSRLPEGRMSSSRRWSRSSSAARRMWRKRTERPQPRAVWP